MSSENMNNTVNGAAQAAAAPENTLAASAASGLDSAISLSFGEAVPEAWVLHPHAGRGLVITIGRKAQKRRMQIKPFSHSRHLPMKAVYGGAPPSCWSPSSMRSSSEHI